MLKLRLSIATLFRQNEADCVSHSIINIYDSVFSTGNFKCHALLNEIQQGPLSGVIESHNVLLPMILKGKLS